MNRCNGKRIKDWSAYIGKRCIVVEDSYLATGVEIKVIDVSPNQNYVTFQFPSGTKRWEEVEKYLLIECL